MNFRNCAVVCLFLFLFLVFGAQTLVIVPKLQSFPAFKITRWSPQSEGYYFSSVFKSLPGATVPYYLTIFDKNGQVVYYKKCRAGQLVSDFRLQKNGLMSFYQRDKFYLMDQTFTIIDSVSCKNGLSTDNHELLILENGHYVLIGMETIQMDLGSYLMWGPKNLPGSPAAKVKCGAIQELDKNKDVVFEWRGKNYFNFADVDPFFMTDRATVDWMHFNSIEIDRDGNFLVSIRYFNEIIKINRKNGAIIWRLGGKQNQFQFTDDHERFIAQHDVRRNKNGHISVFDNGRQGIPSHPASAKEYQLDEKKREVKLVYKYTDDKRAHSLYSGNFQHLTNGNLLINYGSSDTSQTLFNVIKPSGDKVFEVVFDDSLRSYRTYNYSALPWQLKRPAIKSQEKGGKLYLAAEMEYPDYAWSSGEVTRDIEVNHEGNYSVIVPIGSGGFISSPAVVVGLEKGRYKVLKQQSRNNKTNQ